MAFGADPAAAVPSVTYKCSPAPQNCVGWYTSNVTIDWVVTPSDATVVAGCQDKTFTTDTRETNEYCKVDDGEATVTVELKIRLDKTPPTVLGGQPDRGADFGGWYTRPVTVAFSGTDQTSGIDGCTTETYNGPDSGAASLTGRCFDKAGNVGTLGYGLNYDATPPSVTGAGPARSPNPAGWFNAPVAFDFQGSDATSGIASCTTLTYSGPETAAGSVSGTCRDRAGHSAERSFPIKYDATAPSGVTGRAVRGPDRNGWYNRAVRVDFSGSDPLSGIQSCASPTYSGPDGGAVSVPGTCTDVAGNTSNQASVQLSYDDTAPTVTGGTPARGPDVNGWYNRPITVAFGGRDATSGVESCTAPTYSAPDAASASLTGTCTDRAGNVSAPFGYGLSYDGTAPNIAGVTPERSANADGWYNRAVRFDLQATDGTSGIAACPPVTYSGPDSATASFGTSCRDQAGNTSNRTFSLKYDATAPEVTRGAPDRPPNQAGWYRAPVTVDFQGMDGTSGVAGCSRRTYSGPDTSAASVTGTCTDRAGNLSAPLGFGLRYDTTPPAIDKAQTARPADANGWYNHPVSIDFGGADGLSGVASCTSSTYGGPDTDSASVSGTCTDAAGNTSGPQSVGFRYDATPPTQLSATPERGPDANGWYTGPVKFTVAGTDAMSGIESCPAVTYAGPDGAAAAVIGECRDRAANVASRAFGLKFDATAPAVMDLAATAADRSVALSWRTSPDAETVGVTRTPGVGFETATHVFAGPGTSFVDGQVENGVRYAYEVRARDAAGNVGAATITATPLAPAATFSLVESAGGAEPATGLAGGGVAQPATVDDDLDLHLIAPAARAVFRVGRRPLLRWTPVPGASYYNLQLFRRGKILTAWPSKPQHRLKLRWRYRGKRYRLGPGEYQWIVWPGFGPRSKADYGRRIGRRSFEVRAASR
ncbi:MAG TPA: hypothetical protein VG126_00655 [Thermoleophilaceae bacterium]|nr:hypothetical protein [Thermoleophilaceae bacterium]